MGDSLASAWEWREAPETEFAVIGDPIAHSWSPVMQAAALQHLGRRERYLAVRVPPGEVADALARLESNGAMGVNITLPLKEEASQWARVRDVVAERCGAANVLRLAGREAINTDAPAFVATLARLGVAPAAKVVLLGAGGSARAMLPALVDAGYAVAAWNRTQARIESLIAELRLPVAVLPRPSIFDAAVVVNATSASLSAEPLPVPWESAPPKLLAYDLAYSRSLTPFLWAAAEAGVRTVDGRYMLVEQGALSLEWWLGEPAPREVMLRAISTHREEP